MGSSRNENPADSDHRDRGEREREWNELAAIYPPARFRFLGRYYRDATRLQRAPSVSSPFLNRAVSSDIRGCNDNVVDVRRAKFPDRFSFRFGSVSRIRARYRCGV